MLKTIHLAQYDNTLDEALAKAFEENNITRDNLVDIKYSTLVMQVSIDGASNSQLAEAWFASALIIYEKAEVNA